MELNFCDCLAKDMHHSGHAIRQARTAQRLNAQRVKSSMDDEEVGWRRTSGTGSVEGWVIRRTGTGT